MHSLLIKGMAIYAFTLLQGDLLQLDSKMVGSNYVLKCFAE